jgi:NADPH2:quinone reductase
LKAIRVTSLDGPEGLELVEIPAPDPGDRVIVQVHAAGVGFPDLLMTQGRYQFRPDPPFIPGIEMAGVVDSAPGSSPFKPGDRVFSWSGLGAWAEYAIASPLACFHIPDGMSFEQSTSLVNYQSAYFGLIDRGQAREGETVLVHGAAGGVGSAAIDLARALGLTSIAIARGEDKLAVARELGADDLIDADSEWLPEVKRITNDRGVDLVFDPVGGDRFLDSVRSLAVDGRLLIVGFAGGPIPELKVNRLLLKNVSAVGVAWGEYARINPEMPQRIGRALADLWSAGRLNPLVGSSYPLERAPDALREIEERRAQGKVVLKIRE